MALTHSGFDLNIAAKVRQFKTEQGAAQQAGGVDDFVSFKEQYDPGDGQQRVNAVYSAYSSALSSTDIDLRGSLTGPFGDTILFPIVMGIFVQNLSKTAGQYLTVGGATNPFITWLAATGDGVRVGPGGIFCLWSPIDGYATTASTADVLTIAPSSGTPAVKYMIVGRSA